jgi:hypothetical protein
MRELWIPTPKEVAAIRKELEDGDATIAALTARVAELQALLLALRGYVTADEWSDAHRSAEKGDTPC